MGIVMIPPWPKEPLPRKEPEECERLLKACADASPMLDLYAVLLGETGAPCVSEALWVRREDVDLENGFLGLDSSSHGRKTNKEGPRRPPSS